MAKKYWIKERHNPQLGIYFVACGQLTKKEAREYENPLYGDNWMHGYDSEAEYHLAIDKLKVAKERIQGL